MINLLNLNKIFLSKLLLNVCLPSLKSVSALSPVLPAATPQPSCRVGFAAIHLLSWMLFLWFLSSASERWRMGATEFHLTSVHIWKLHCFVSTVEIKIIRKRVRKHIRNASENTVRSTNYLFLAYKLREKKHVSLPLFLSALSHVRKAKWDIKKWVTTLFTLSLFYISVRGRRNRPETLPDHQFDTGIRSTNTKHWLGGSPQVRGLSVLGGNRTHSAPWKRKLQ